MPELTSERLSQSGRKWFLVILALAALLRLENLTVPLSGWHAWRQADTAAMARNFYFEHKPIWLPSVDWRGNTPGYVESEFPAYAYAVAMAYRIFGVSTPVARLISILCSLLTMWMLVRILRPRIGEMATLVTTFLIAVMPLSIMVGRAIMPESSVTLCMVSGIYWFDRWLGSRRLRDGFYAVGLLSLCILGKLPSLYVGLPLIILMLERDGLRTFRQPRSWIAAFAILAPPAIWYWYANRLFKETGLSFGIWMPGTDKWANWELLADPGFYHLIFLERLAGLAFGIVGLLGIVLGLVLAMRAPRARLIAGWFAAVLIYVAIVGRGNEVHDYYQWPFLVPGAALCGIACVKLRDAWFSRGRLVRYGRVSAGLTVIGYLVFSAIVTQRLLSWEWTYAPFTEMGRRVQTIVPRDARIVCVDNGDPIGLYHAGRYGWRAMTGDVNEGYIADKIRMGAEFLIGPKFLFGENESRESLQKIAQSFEILADDPAYFIIRLQSRSDHLDAEFGAGWLEKEAWGRWAVGSAARLSFADLGNMTKLVLGVAAWQGMGGTQTVQVVVGDRVLAERIIDGEPWKFEDWTIDLPSDMGQRSMDVELRFARTWGEMPTAWALPVAHAYLTVPGARSLEFDTTR